MNASPYPRILWMLTIHCLWYTWGSISVANTENHCVIQFSLGRLSSVPSCSPLMHILVLVKIPAWGVNIVCQVISTITRPYLTCRLQCLLFLVSFSPLLFLSIVPSCGLLTYHAFQQTLQFRGLLPLLPASSSPNTPHPCPCILHPKEKQYLNERNNKMRQEWKVWQWGMRKVGLF